MSIDDKHDALMALTLGKPTAYHDHYDASLLQAVPRSLNRDPLGICATSLPFHGEDIWTMYELSWLGLNGVPQVAIGEMHLRADSLNLIESKSFKLYLNSFNQTRFESRQQVQGILAQDLAACAQGDVRVTLFALDQVAGHTLSRFPGEGIDEQDIEISDYRFNADYLATACGADSPVVEETLVSHLLKSNCLITHQPDWGSVQIQYRGKQIDREALLRYIVSFRHHNEFHEQCVERIFTDLMRFCQPETLTVYARYTRRGGLDINPWRSNIAQVTSTDRLPRQ